MSEAIAKAKDTLLRALEQLEGAESDLDASPDRVDLIVVYSIGSDKGDGAWHEVGGWSSTAAPKWLFAALLERAATAFKDDSEPYAQDDEDEPDDPHPTFGGGS